MEDSEGEQKAAEKKTEPHHYTISGIVLRLEPVARKTERRDGEGAEQLVPREKRPVDQQPEEKAQKEGNFHRKEQQHPAAGG